MALIECEECGHHVSEKAQACPKCGAPVAGAHVPSIEDEERHRAEVRVRAEEEAKQKIEGEKKAQAQKESQQGCLGCLGLIIVLVVIVKLLPDTDSAAHKTGASSPGDLSTMAVVQSRNYVRDSLSTPSTADFPWLDHSVLATGNETYIVKSYVDAQNEFGATVRYHFVCKVRYTGGDHADQRNWALVDLALVPR